MIHSLSKFYLASSSPRRRSLLQGVGLHFEVIGVDVDESIRAGEKPADFVARLARVKADAGVARIGDERLRLLPVLAADTCVAIDDRILGKPRDSHHARSMLQSLSGRTHQVFTAVALKAGESIWQELSRSLVTFGEVTPDALEAYCASGEVEDKAGAYAIQGLGAAFVKRVDGSYTGVVGLPMYETRRLLNKIDVDWL